MAKNEFHSSLTNLADLIAKLNTFLGGNGWTTHHAPGSGEFAARKTGTGIDVGFAMQWDTGTPDHIGVYQFHGAAYNNSFAPYDQNDDSGNGAQSTTDATIAAQRHVEISNTPKSAWFFIPDTNDETFYVVVWREGTGDASKFVHFGAGYLDKFNDWDGGEFVYGQQTDETYNSSQPTRKGNSILLDGLSDDQSPITDMELRVATMRLEGMDDEPSASTKYAVCMGDQGSGDLGTDRQGVAGGARTNVGRVHVLGGFRGGMFVPTFMNIRGSIQKGLVNLSPIQQYFWNRTTGDVRPLGQMVDIAQLNINDYSAEGGDEVVIDGDTWVIFPSHRKKGGTTIGATGNQGIAYKKVP